MPKDSNKARQLIESVPPLGQMAGVGPGETNILVTHLKETEIIILLKTQYYDEESGGESVSRWKIT